jgi:hypothetical protein
MSGGDVVGTSARAFNYGIPQPPRLGGGLLVIETTSVAFLLSIIEEQRQFGRKWSKFG